jgi:hypothetical protein
MFGSCEEFPNEKYPRIKNETFMLFLKRFSLLVELTPLHSRARSTGDAKILKQSLKHWFVPTKLIREYYGDHVAIYFSWMNHFISNSINLITFLEWLILPGAMALVFWCIDMIVWGTSDVAEDGHKHSVGDSPLCSVYSLFIAVWGTLFVIVRSSLITNTYSFGTGSARVSMWSGTTILCPFRKTTLERSSMALSK